MTMGVGGGGHGAVAIAPLGTDSTFVLRIRLDPSGDFALALDERWAIDDVRIRREPSHAPPVEGDRAARLAQSCPHP